MSEELLWRNTNIILGSRITFEEMDYLDDLLGADRWFDAEPINARREVLFVREDVPESLITLIALKFNKRKEIQ